MQDVIENEKRSTNCTNTSGTESIERDDTDLTLISSELAFEKDRII